MLARSLRRLAGRITRLPGLRAAVVRTLLRNDEIVPFGRGLAFDPGTWVIKETEYGFRIWVALGERSISREIMLDRYERDEVACVQSIVRPGERVIDVGANIGFYTALLASLVGPMGHVVACEPLDAVAVALDRTIAENRYSDRVTVRRVALDAAGGSALLRHAPITINAGAAYLAPVSAPPPGHIDQRVPTLTLDEISGNGPCAFVKLDAEGAEPRILAGAERTLMQHRPTILAELNPLLLERVSGKHPDDVIAQMLSYRYVAHRLRGSAPGEIITRYGDSASINVLFMPKH